MNLGPSEILVILVIALIVFGPRKLPELGKSLGSAMAQFRRASDDFKRSWEQEVELEKSRTSDDQHTASISSYSSPEETAVNGSGHTATEVASTTPEPVPATAALAQEKPRSEHWI